jgi:hypothetical protein
MLITLKVGYFLILGIFLPRDRCNGLSVNQMVIKIVLTVIVSFQQFD